MKNIRNNYKRNRYRNNNDRGYKNNNGTSQKYNGDFIVSSEFKRKKPSKNINASKLIEKYTELAKEALSNGDKILSENYYQHADHFQRIFDNQNIERIEKEANKNQSLNISDEKIL